MLLACICDSIKRRGIPLRRLGESWWSGRIGYVLGLAYPPCPRSQKRLGLRATRWNRPSTRPDESSLPSSTGREIAQALGQTCHLGSLGTIDTPSTINRSVPAGDTRRHRNRAPMLLSTSWPSLRWLAHLLFQESQILDQPPAHIWEFVAPCHVGLQPTMTAILPIPTLPSTKASPHCPPTMPETYSQQETASESTTLYTHTAE